MRDVPIAEDTLTGALRRWEAKGIGKDEMVLVGTTATLPATKQVEANQSTSFSIASDKTIQSKSSTTVLSPAESLGPHEVAKLIRLLASLPIGSSVPPLLDPGAVTLQRTLEYQATAMKQVLEDAEKRSAERISRLRVLVEEVSCYRGRVIAQTG